MKIYLIYDTIKKEYCSTVPGKVAWAKKGSAKSAIMNFLSWSRPIQWDNQTQYECHEIDVGKLPSELIKNV